MGTAHLTGAQQEVDQRQHVSDQRELDVILEDCRQQRFEMLAQPVHLSPLALGIRLQRQNGARNEPFRGARNDLSGDRIAEGRRCACAEEENPPCCFAFVPTARCLETKRRHAAEII